MGLAVNITIPACCFTMDERAYTDLYIPFAQTHFETWVLTQSPITQAGMSFVMLWTTLLFERKITQNQCTFLTIIVFEPTVEAAVSIYNEANSNTPEALTYAGYNNTVFGDLHVIQLALLFYLGAAVHGLIVFHRSDMACNNLR